MFGYSRPLLFAVYYKLFGARINESLFSVNPQVWLHNTLFACHCIFYY